MSTISVTDTSEQPYFIFLISSSFYVMHVAESTYETALGISLNSSTGHYANGLLCLMAPCGEQCGQPTHKSHQSLTLQTQAHSFFTTLLQQVMVVTGSKPT